MKIFLAVLEDRHIDNEYKAFLTKESAIKHCKEWEKDYENSYHWDNTKCPQAWDYYSRTKVDDGPKIHVEQIELNEQP
jgi:hypothetical protein